MGILAKNQVGVEGPRRLSINTESELKAAFDRTIRYTEEKYGKNVIDEKWMHDHRKLYAEKFRKHLKKKEAERKARAARLAKEKHDG